MFFRQDYQVGKIEYRRFRRWDFEPRHSCTKALFPCCDQRSTSAITFASANAFKYKRSDSSTLVEIVCLGGAIKLTTMCLTGRPAQTIAVQQKPLNPLNNLLLHFTIKE